MLLVAPLAPHIAEEMWARLGHDESSAWHPFPVADERWLVDDTVEVAVQVNGKVRAQVSVPADADAAALEAAARADERIAGYLDGATVRRVIAVPGRLVNFVLGVAGVAQRAFCARATPVRRGWVRTRGRGSWRPRPGRSRRRP